MKFLSKSIHFLAVLVVMSTCNRSPVPEPCYSPVTSMDTCDVVEIEDSADSNCDTITFDTTGKDVMLHGD
jgi:hypothetical protein